MDQNRPHRKPRTRKEETRTYRVVTYRDSVGRQSFYGFALLSAASYKSLHQGMSNIFGEEGIGYYNHRVMAPREFVRHVSGSVIHTPAIDIAYTTYDDLRNTMRVDLVTDAEAEALVRIFFEPASDLWGRRTYGGFYGSFPKGIFYT